MIERQGAKMLKIKQELLTSACGFEQATSFAAEVTAGLQIITHGSTNVCSETSEAIRAHTPFLRPLRSPLGLHLYLSVYETWGPYLLCLYTLPSDRDRRQSWSIFISFCPL